MRCHPLNVCPVYKMSLLPSVTGESSVGIPQFIEASYTAGGAAMISTGAASGVVRIAPATTGITAGTAFIRGGPGAVSLTLGANDTVNSQIGVGNGGVSIFTPLTVGTSLTVTGPADFDQSISLSNQQVQDNLRYTQPFGPIADATNDQPLGTAQPALIAGSYAIAVQIVGNPQIQPSCIGYWNGAQWSAGANGAGHAYPGGGVAVGIRPAPGGASLLMSNGSGAPVSGFVYYISLGEN